MAQFEYLSRINSRTIKKGGHLGVFILEKSLDYDWKSLDLEMGVVGAVGPSPVVPTRVGRVDRDQPGEACKGRRDLSSESLAGSLRDR